MINFIALGITLVLAQLLTIAITYFVVFKLLTSKKFIKGYLKWAKDIVNITEELDL